MKNLEDGSALQKMHKEKFKCPMIPFGAKVAFKPSDGKEREQDTNFDPKGLIGIFAGYMIESGNKWSRKMLVWNLQDFAKANLAFNCEQVPMSLKRPHVTKRVELETPVKFPLKDEYERLNATLEGVNTIGDREGRPDVDDMIDDDPVMMIKTLNTHQLKSGTVSIVMMTKMVMIMIKPITNAQFLNKAARDHWKSQEVFV